MFPLQTSQSLEILRAELSLYFNRETVHQAAQSIGSRHERITHVQNLRGKLIEIRAPAHLLSDTCLQLLAIASGLSLSIHPLRGCANWSGFAKTNRDIGQRAKRLLNLLLAIGRDSYAGHDDIAGVARYFDGVAQIRTDLV